MPSNSPASARSHSLVPHVIAIRRDVSGYGIRFGLSEAEDALMHGPVFGTLPEALAWIDALDQADGSRASAMRSGDAMRSGHLGR